jgi:aquaporin Z
MLRRRGVHRVRRIGGRSISDVTRAGAVAAALAGYAILGRTFAPAPATTATVTVTVTVAGALTVEGLYTFALALVVLNSAVAVKTLGNSFYGLAIGFTIVVAAFAGGPISGGAFNPAVGLDPIVVNAVLGGGTVANLWIYLVGPLVGGALAAGVFGVQEQEPISMHSKASQTPEQTPV